MNYGSSWVGQRVWQAMALAVPSRLWLGGVVRAQRDGVLIRRLVDCVQACVASGPLLVRVDGLASYVTAFVRAGRRGRPRLVLDACFQLGQVVKQYAKRRLTAVSQLIIHGTPATFAAAMAATGAGSQINTAFIELLNATFRACVVPLIRRGRALARTEASLVAGMFLVGFAYNFRSRHDGLRLLAPSGARRKWHERTPAIAAGLTDHCWTMDELLRYQIPLPAWVAGKRRGRPSKSTPRPRKELAA